jgi:hypothetical protein
MYTNPEIARTIAAQRSQEMQARAEVSRQVAEARAARRTEGSRTARFRWMARRSTAQRTAVGYSSVPSA